jgi:hypothetical protein
VTPQAFAARVRTDLSQRRWLRWHCFLIGALTFFCAWFASHLLMRAGSEALWLRYGAAFGVAYLVFIALLYWWVRWLLSRDEGDVPQIDGGWSDASPSARSNGEPSFKSGEGGDFGGAGGGGSFDAPGGDAAGEAVGGALEVAAAADEGVIVLLPLALVVGAALALGTVLGFVVFGLFGVEVLLAVAVELALASIGGALAFKAGREGWLQAAWRRTRGPAAAALVTLMLVGGAIDRWLPQANSLPQALKLLLA